MEIVSMAFKRSAVRSRLSPPSEKPWNFTVPGLFSMLGRVVRGRFCARPGRSDILIHAFGRLEHEKEILEVKIV